MALQKGIKPFDMGERMKPKTLTPEPTPTHNHTHDGVYEPEQKENKTKRVQLLTYESLVDRMDAYAAKRGVKRVAVFEAAMTAYLDKVDPQE